MYTRSLRIGPVSIDLAARSIRRGDEDVHLRPKTFDVLLYLVQNPERVVTKEELVEACWKDTAVTDDALIRCILEIRRLLGDDPKAPVFIKNIPKVGYRLIAPVVEEDATIVPLPAEPAPPLVTEPPAPAPPRKLPSRRIGIGVAVAAATLLGAALTIPRPGTFLPKKTHPVGEALVRWRLDGNAATEGRGGQTGGKISGHAQWPAGVLGSAALQLAGADSFVEGKGIGFPSGDSRRAISAWIRPMTSAADTMPVLDYGSHTHRPGDNFLLGVDHRGRLLLESGWGKDKLVGATQLLDGGFHHVAGVYHGAPDHKAVLYVDGVEDGRATFPKGLATVDGRSWRIGSALGGGTTFRGAIDDVRVFTEPLHAHEVQALYRCGSGKADAPGGYYFLPVFPMNSTSILNGEITNTGKDFSGIQLRRMDNDCDLAAMYGSDLGQDLRIRVELLVPGSDAAGHTQAGPYFRARAAYPGDGIIGGSATGYWVVLWSTGVVQVRRLNPSATVAVAQAPAGFDAGIFHTLETEVRGESLSVHLDGAALIFDLNGRMSASVPVPPAWDGPPKLGSNDGAAGLALMSITNRGKAGGQKARNLMVQIAY